MPDDQRPDDAPSLEAPSLGRLFGRRKGKAADETPDAQPSAHETPVPESGADETSTQAASTPGAAAPATSTAARDDSPEETVVLETAPAQAPPAAPPVEEPAVAAPAPAAAAPAPAAVPAPTPKAPRAPLSIDGRVAAGVTGLVVGLLVVLLTAGSLRLCESVRGVSTCGGGPGFTLLVAVMVAMVLLGGTLLRLARVPDPMSTSFLAVGLTCVLSLLFLVDVLQEWWMVIVIPVMTVATFLLSHWVTTSVIEPAEG
jgi:hypothetical protein